MRYATIKFEIPGYPQVEGLRLVETFERLSRSG